MKIRARDILEKRAEKTTYECAQGGCEECREKIQKAHSPSTSSEEKREKGYRHKAPAKHGSRRVVARPPMLRARDIIDKRRAMDDPTLQPCPHCRGEGCKSCGGKGTIPKKSRRVVARPPMPAGMPQGPAEMDAPGMDGSMPPDDMQMEEEMPQEPEEEQQDIPSMVENISQNFLSDDKMNEIQDAVMALMGAVAPDMATDIAKQFGKFMEAAALLKADLKALTIMGTPQNNLKQLQLAPEDQEDDMRSDILT